MNEDNNGNLEVIPATEDKEIQIEYHRIQFKDSLKLISSPLKTIVAQTLRDDLEHYKHTKTQLRRYCKERDKQCSDKYIDLLTWKEPMFYTLIKSYDSLNNTLIPSRSKLKAKWYERAFGWRSYPGMEGLRWLTICLFVCIPSREQCYNDMKGEMMPQDEYDHMMKLWNTFDIKTWSEYYELYNVLDVTLMADAFEHFRNITLNAFGVDLMYYITTPQMAIHSS